MKIEELCRHCGKLLEKSMIENLTFNKCEFQFVADPRLKPNDLCGDKISILGITLTFFNGCAPGDILLIRREETVPNFFDVEVFGRKIDFFEPGPNTICYQNGLIRA